MVHTSVYCNDQVVTQGTIYNVKHNISITFLNSSRCIITISLYISCKSH